MCGVDEVPRAEEEEEEEQFEEKDDREADADYAGGAEEEDDEEDLAEDQLPLPSKRRHSEKGSRRKRQADGDAEADGEDGTSKKRRTGAKRQEKEARVAAGEPKRALNAYLHFSQAERAKLHAERPGASVGENAAVVQRIAQRIHLLLICLAAATSAATSESAGIAM